jgi:hypothetical protein
MKPFQQFCSIPVAVTCLILATCAGIAMQFYGSWFWHGFFYSLAGMFLSDIVHVYRRRNNGLSPL